MCCPSTLLLLYRPHSWTGTKIFSPRVLTILAILSPSPHPISWLCDRTLPIIFSSPVGWIELWKPRPSALLVLSNIGMCLHRILDMFYPRRPWLNWYRWRWNWNLGSSQCVPSKLPYICHCRYPTAYKFYQSKLYRRYILRTRTEQPKSSQYALRAPELVIRV